MYVLEWQLVCRFPKFGGTMKNSANVNIIKLLAYSLFYYSRVVRATIGEQLVPTQPPPNKNAIG
jgi:hypothetical protein